MQAKDEEMQELQLKTRYLANSISRLCYNLRKSGHVKSIVKVGRVGCAGGKEMGWRRVRVCLRLYLRTHTYRGRETEIL